MKKTCKKCSKEYEEEIEENIGLRKIGKKKVIEIMTEASESSGLLILSDAVGRFKELEKLVVGTYKRLIGLCSDCRDKLICSDSRLSKNIAAKMIRSVTSVLNKPEDYLIEIVESDAKAWSMIKRAAKEKGVTPKVLLKEAVKEYIRLKKEDFSLFFYSSPYQTGSNFVQDPEPLKIAEKAVFVLK